MKVVWVLANNSSAPYFTWFAKKAVTDPSIELSFVALYPTEPDMIAEMKAMNIKAHWINFDHRKRKTSMLSAIPALTRLFRKIKPDIVHAHLFDDALPTLVAARLAGIKIRVITKGDAAFHWYFAKKGVKFDRLNNRNATHIIALSEESKSFILQNEKADPEKVHLIHHGIPPEEITYQTDGTRLALRRRFGLTSQHIAIGTISRFIEWKGYLAILDAIEILSKENSELRFLFTGNGDQKEVIQSLIAKRNLSKCIIFTGWIDRNEIPSYYGILDIFLHAAQMEPFGLVIAEAMLNGVPLVSTPTGAAKDAIKSKENGYLVTSPSGSAIAEGIRFMLDHDRKQIGEAGRITATEMFTLETMWMNHMALYTTAMNETE